MGFRDGRKRHLKGRKTDRLSGASDGASAGRIHRLQSRTGTCCYPACLLQTYLNDAREKFTRFAQVVFGVETAEQELDALEAFIKECGLPTKMSQLKSKVEITEEVLRQVADTSNIIKCNPRELDRQEIYQILTECM